jgi:oxalate decarboxylase/phosphoglucose isomerase-like protein (cupin superfamily)
MTDPDSTNAHYSRPIDPVAWKARPPLFTGSEVTLILHPDVPGADMYGGINVLAPGHHIPLHWHGVGEFQYILRGRGFALDSRGKRILIADRSVVYSPAGAAGAHGFVNAGDEPLEILFLYPSPGGRPPTVSVVDGVVL